MDIWHTNPKHISQPLKFLIIFNRFGLDDQFIVKIGPLYLYIWIVDFM